MISMKDLFNQSTDPVPVVSAIGGLDGVEHLPFQGQQPGIVEERLPEIRLRNRGSWERSDQVTSTGDGINKLEAESQPPRAREWRCKVFSPAVKRMLVPDFGSQHLIRAISCVSTRTNSAALALVEFSMYAPIRD
jgi:hypothetical protein